jgi:hypothetical protein
MSDERRRAPRFSVHVQANIKLPGDTAAHAVMLENLCVLGCLLEYAPILEPRQKCEFFMSWKGWNFASPALVASKGHRDQVGLEFHDTDADNEYYLREVCAELLMKTLVRLRSDR